MITIIRRIKQEILGRFALGNTEAELLGWVVEQSGNGDYLEIGTLFGGSAILAGMVKKERGLEGHVVCLDPLNGYYMGTGEHTNMLDPIARKPITRETLDSNLQHFSTHDITEIIQKNSYPFPAELKNRQFSCSFIDGNHRSNYPTCDWHSVKNITTGYIIFDNCEKKYPAVQKACELASSTAGWSHVKTEHSLVVFKRDA